MISILAKILKTTFKKLATAEKIYTNIAGKKSYSTVIKFQSQAKNTFSRPSPPI